MKNYILCFVVTLFIPCIGYTGINDYFISDLDGPPLFKTRNYKKAIKVLDEKEVLASFVNFMNINNFPKTGEVINFIENEVVHTCNGSRRIYKCIKNKTLSYIYILRYNNYIDNLFFLLLNNFKYENNKIYNLQNYLKSLYSLKKSRATTINSKPVDNLSFLNTLTLRQNFLSYKKLTPRQVLYLKYNSFQIKYLSHLLEKTIRIMNSQTAYIYIQFNSNLDENLKIELSYSEKYRLALKLLKHELNKLLFDSRFGIVPKYIDVLSAAIETGLISIEDLKILYQMPELRDPYRDRFKVYGEMLKRIVKYALTNTPIVGPISIVPILLLELRKQLKDSRNGISDETHLF